MVTVRLSFVLFFLSLVFEKTLSIRVTRPDRFCGNSQARSPPDQVTSRVSNEPALEHGGHHYSEAVWGLHPLKSKCKGSESAGTVQLPRANDLAGWVTTLISTGFDYRLSSVIVMFGARDGTDVLRSDAYLEPHIDNFRERFGAYRCRWCGWAGGCVCGSVRPCHLAAVNFRWGVPCRAHSCASRAALLLFDVAVFIGTRATLCAARHRQVHSGA
jgi:hypothetical protein